MSFARAMTRGFTLIEMAIVLVVIGIMLSGGLVAIRPIIDNTKNTDTRARMERIESALQIHVIRFGCLPCPAAVAGDGTADVVGGAAGCGTSCTSDRGVVPWQTLGLSRIEGSDAFGTRFTYEVTPALIAANSMIRSGTSYTPLGAVRVRDAAGGTVTDEAAYVVVSHGANREYGYHEVTGTQFPAVVAAPAEEENGDADDLYVQDDFNDTAANHFDDLVLWRSKPIIIQRCGGGACGNPA